MDIFWKHTIFQFTRWTILRTIENFWYSSHKMECIPENVVWIPCLDMDLLCSAKWCEIMFWPWGLKSLLYICFHFVCLEHKSVVVMSIVSIFMLSKTFLV